MILREKAYQTIKERIVSGYYRPGQPLCEKEIIEENKANELASSLKEEESTINDKTPDLPSPGS